MIEIPAKVDDEKVITDKEYFYVYKLINSKLKLKKKPTKITILWDKSASLQYRNITKELEFLGKYIHFLENVEIKLITFSNVVHSTQKFIIKKGNWTNLKSEIQKMSYDGGTNLNAIKALVNTSDENLLFSDGMSNLSDLSLKSKKPLYFVNSLVSANHDKMEQISNNSGANYINLTKIQIKAAVDMISYQNYKFLGFKNSLNKTTEIYPNYPVVVSHDFTIVGKNFSFDKPLELQFGYGNQVTDIIKIDILKTNVVNDRMGRVWAQNKLKFLSQNEDRNKEKIIKLALDYDLVSQFTSLIVLDRVEDYVRYKIKPPVELLEEYTELLAGLVEEDEYDKDKLLDLKEELQDDYSDLLEWYGEKFIIKKETTVSLSKNKARNIEIPTPEGLGKRSPVLSATNNESNEVDVQTRTLTQEQLQNYGTIMITGTVLSADDGFPLPGLQVTIKGINIGTQTDFEGIYTIKANKGDILQYSYVGMVTLGQVVRDSNTIDVVIASDDNTLDEVVVMGTFVSKAVTSELGQSFLQGKVAGVQIVNEAGESGATSQIAIRGLSSIADGQPLFIIDGVVLERDYDLSTSNIAEIYVLKEQTAMSLYGTRALNGVIIIKTNAAVDEDNDTLTDFENRINDEIEFKAWDADMPYLKILEKEKTIKAAYTTYLDLKGKYGNTPTFYIDISEFFAKKKEDKLAIRILTNLAEINIDNYELLKALAYKLEVYEEFDLVVYIYNEILKLRPEDIQSYRDLALAYEEIGEYQKSLDLLYKIINGELLEKDPERRFEGVEAIAFNEFNSLISRHKSKLNLKGVDKRYIKKMPIAIRAVIDWNHNDTDIDLWINDPNDEDCGYDNNETKLGGRLSEDMTDGFGPEEFLLKKAIKGSYSFKIDYYSDDMQKISGPTFLKITLYTKFGTKKQKKSIRVIRLDNEEDEVNVGVIKI